MLSDEAQFKRFRIGEEFTNALADITDTNYSAHYHEMVMALQVLLDSGQMRSSTVEQLGMVSVLLPQGRYFYWRANGWSRMLGNWPTMVQCFG